MKRILKVIISLIYFLFMKCLYYVKNFGNLRNKPKCVVLYYHSIFDNEVNNFRKQINLILKHTKTLSSDFNGELNDNQLYSIITFDDGYQNLIKNAIPILKEKGIPFTIFFVTNYFGKKPDWEEIEKHKDKTEKLMNTEQILNLPKNLLTIGSHTANHKMLDKLSLEEIKYELSESKKVLEELTKSKIELLSFPNGRFNDKVVKESFSAGYKRVFTIEPKLALVNSNEKIIGRVDVNGNDYLLEFWLKLNGAYSWMAVISKIKQKILKLLGNNID